MRRVVVLLVWLLPTAVINAQTPADTQASATEELHSALAKKELVFVRQPDSDMEISGQLLGLTTDSLSLLRPDGSRVEVPFSRVERIQRQGDSLHNGAAIGALVLGGWCLAICGQGLDSGSQLLPVAAVNAAIGALIGLAIDSQRQGRTTIYPEARRAGSSRPSTAVPFISVRVGF